MFNKAQREVAEQSGKTEKSVGSLDSAIHAISPSTLLAVAGITSLIASIKSLVNVSSNIINVTSQFEQTQKSLETVLQSAEKGQKLFEDLRKFSFDTTFGVDELANASSQLLNVGVSTKVLQKDLKMLGDLAQGDKAKFQELTSIFAKIQSTGKASSMQLQQLALRGIPIMQTLKDMGVTGVASAEDLTQAFQKLTGEGGQFHNAMNNIIDTIEGKKGFITDTWKEILVNFGQLSGLTDAFKDALDRVYKVLDKVNNKLIEWNNNPVAKAILQGTIKTALMAIVGIIVGSLVPALSTVAGLLGAINSTVWIGLAVGAVTGIVTGFISETAQLENTLNGVQDIAKETKSLIDELDLGDINQKKAEKNQKKGTSTAEEDTLIAIKRYEQAKIDLLNMKAELDKTDKTLWSLEDIKESEKMVADQERLVKYFELQSKYEQGLLKQEQGRMSALEQTTAYYDQLETDFEKFEKSLGSVENRDTKVNKLLEEQSETQMQLNKLLEDYEKKYYKLTSDGKKIKLELSEESKKAFERDITQLKANLKQIEVEIKLANMKDWQKEMQKAFSLDDETIANLIGQSGDKWVQEARKLSGAKQQQRDATYKALGINQRPQTQDDQKKLAEIQAQALLKTMDTLLDGKGGFGVQENGELDNTFKELQTELDKTKQQFIDAGGTLEKWDEILGNSAQKIEELSFADLLQRTVIEAGQSLKSGGGLSDVGSYAGAKMGQQLVSNSGDASNFVQGFEEGGVIGGVINTLISAFMNVAKEMDNFDKVMNPITFMMKAVKPAIKTIFSILERGVDVLPLIGTIINKIVELLEPILNIITDLVVDFIEDLYVVLEILTPLLNILKMLFSIIRAIIAPFRLLAAAITGLINLLKQIPAIRKLVDGIEDVTEKIEKSCNNFVNDINETTKELRGVKEAEQKALEQTKDEEEKEKATKDLTGEYKSLLEAMKENEEWYLKEKTALNANTRKQGYQSVNDMILTPQGNFSTDPNDYIIATKNPQSLGGGAVFNMKIENNVANDVDVSATATPNGNGGQDILVMISRKIAQDVANGANGWDSARASQNARLAGRMVQL